MLKMDVLKGVEVVAVVVEEGNNDEKVSSIKNKRNKGSKNFHVPCRCLPDRAPARPYILLKKAIRFQVGCL